MITNLVQIRRLGEKNRQENERFRKYLKSHDWVERQFRRAAEDIQDAIDCRQCAECCRITEVEINERDIERLAKFLKIKPSKFREEYMGIGDEGEPILRRTKSGCVFLSEKECTVYEARPRNCEGFPHVVRGPGSIASRMWAFVDRATYCPIVYNWMETVKDLTKFKKGAPKK